MGKPNNVDTSGRPPVNVSSRIPSTLQAVFLASNRGNVVNTPPPRQVAFKTFRSWFGRTFATDSKNRKSCKGEVPTKTVVCKTLQPELLVSKDVQSEPLESKAANSPKKKKKTIRAPTLSPQQYMNAMIRSRGYSVVTYATLASAYHNKPTPLQEASYGLHVIALVKSGDAEGLRSALASGLSPNPSNNHGESLLHMICRRGDSGLLSVMLEIGCDIQVADDYGRTPLHDACWASEPAFELVDKLLERDSKLFFMTDSRGAVPLSYVRKEHWSQWLQYLESKKEVYWPRRSGEEPAPVLSLQKPNTRPVPDPEQALTVELARMVANGRMTPAEAMFLNSDIEDDESSSSEDYESDDDDDDSDFSCASDDDCSVMSGGKNELMERVSTQLTSQPVAFSQ